MWHIKHVLKKWRIHKPKTLLFVMLEALRLHVQLHIISLSTLRRSVQSRMFALRFYEHKVQPWEVKWKQIVKQKSWQKLFQTFSIMKLNIFTRERGESWKVFKLEVRRHSVSPQPGNLKCAFRGFNGATREAWQEDKKKSPPLRIPHYS